MMIGKEDELIPVVLSGTALHESVKGFGFAGSLDAHYVASQEIDPVFLRRTEQYVGCSERNVVGGKLGANGGRRRTYQSSPAFPR